MNDKNKAFSFFLDFVKRNIISILLLLILLVVLIYSRINSTQTEKDYKERLSEIVSIYEAELDSLEYSKITYLTEYTAKIVSGYIVENRIDLLNDSFLFLLENPHIEKITIINASDARILFSTVKKDEGRLFRGIAVLTAGNFTIDSGEDLHKMICPVYYNNMRIAILLVDVKP